MSGYMLAVCVCFGLVAVGEVISYVTKAVIPSMAGALVLYLILIWCGMPQSYPETAGFTTIGVKLFDAQIEHFKKSIFHINFFPKISRRCKPASEL